MTVNDVFLAGVAGGLRRWLEHARRARCRGCERRSRSASTTATRAQAELGNRDSFLNVDLPLHEPDPLARLEPINAETAHAQAARRRRGALRPLPCPARGSSTSIARRSASPAARASSASRSPTSPARGSRAQRRRPRGRATCSRSPSRPTATRCASRRSPAPALVGIGLCTDPEAVAGVAELAARDRRLVRRACAPHPG